MALTFSQREDAAAYAGRQSALLSAGRIYAWSGLAITWCFWVSFVISLANPPQVARFWPLPTIDRGGAVENPYGGALIDALLIALFGLQHSLMARPWFKNWWAACVRDAFERCSFIHMANLALLLFAGASSFGIFDLLGIDEEDHKRFRM